MLARNQAKDPVPEEFKPLIVRAPWILAMGAVSQSALEVFDLVKMVTEQSLDLRALFCGHCQMAPNPTSAALVALPLASWPDRRSVCNGRKGHLVSGRTW